MEIKEPEITWETLTKIEPRLLDLYQGARFAGTGYPEYCVYDAWYGKGNVPGFKMLVTKLAGYEAEGSNPLLFTTAAYDIAYKTVFNALPPCRGHCGHDDNVDPFEVIQHDPSNWDL